MRPGLDLHELRPKELLKGCLSDLHCALQYNDDMRKHKRRLARYAAWEVGATLTLYVLIGMTILLLIVLSF